MYEVSLILKAAYTGTCVGAARSLTKYLTKSNICNNSFTGELLVSIVADILWEDTFLIPIYADMNLSNIGCTAA